MWSLTLRDQHRKPLGEIFGSKRNEVSTAGRVMIYAGCLVLFE
jgi:hypothetical protein